MCYLSALQHLLIIQDSTSQITKFETAPCTTDTSHSNWAQYPGSLLFELKT